MAITLGGQSIVVSSRRRALAVKVLFAHCFILCSRVQEMNVECTIEPNVGK